MKYVSIAESRAGSKTPEGVDVPADEPTPNTSDTRSAKSNHGGKSVSNTEEN